MAVQVTSIVLDTQAVVHRAGEVAGLSDSPRDRIVHCQALPLDWHRSCR